MVIKMLKQGTCKYYNGVWGPGLSHDKKCGKGVDYRKLVGGDKHGWVKRIPCFKKHETDIKCDLYIEPTPEEIEQAEKDWNEWVDRTIPVLNLMPKLKEENPSGGSGVMKCPVCENQLHWSVAALNLHVRLRCVKDGCVSIVE